MSRWNLGKAESGNRPMNWPALALRERRARRGGDQLGHGAADGRPLASELLAPSTTSTLSTLGVLTATREEPRATPHPVEAGIAHPSLWTVQVSSNDTSPAWQPTAA